MIQRTLTSLWIRLASPYGGVWAALLGICLTLPALWSGFAQDDHFFLMVFQDSPGLDLRDHHPLETFSFSKGDIALQPVLTERGFMPWWAVDGWKVNFWRPVASFSNWIDYLLFGERAWIMHLHSLLFYGVLIFVAWVVYRRFLGAGATAGCAAALFAMDSGHAIPVTWLSMRNALMTLFFGLLVLYAHDRWRQTRSQGTLRFASWLPFGPLALLSLVLALLSGESAVAVGGFLFAYALFMDPTAQGGKFKAIVGSVVALLPYLAVVFVWRIVYSGLGYGTEGSGLYIDPISNPDEFLSRLPAHMAVLLLGLFGLPDAGLWGLTPAPWNHIHLVIAVLFVLISIPVLWPLLQASKVARFFLLGTLLAMVPACATMPMDRLMTFASFGALGLVAVFLAGVQESSSWLGPRRKVYRYTALFLVLAHGLFAPINLVSGTQQIKIMNRILTDSNPSIPLELPDNTRIVALNTPIDLLGASFPIYRSSRNEPVPEHWWWLYSGVDEIAVERPDERTLILRPEGGYLKPLWSDIFRFAATHPMREGDSIALEGLHILVLEVSPDGRPLAVRFEFSAPLEDPTYYFVTWQNGTYVSYTVPAPGGHHTIPAARIRELIPVALGFERP